MKFKSRFNPPPSAPPVSSAKLTAEFTDRVDLTGQAISLRDLRDLVYSVSDWPDEAVVDVRRWPSVARIVDGNAPDNIGIVVKVRENR